MYDITTKGGENMGRPTDDPKPFRVNLRISKEMNDKLQSEANKAGLTIAEYVRGLISDSDFRLIGKQTKLIKDIFQMAKLSGVSGEDFLRNLDNALTQGTLVIENGRLVSTINLGKENNAKR